MLAVKGGSEAVCEGGPPRDHLRDERVAERASAPFLFRTGGLNNSGKKVWTLRAMVRHLDRHPEDGVFHLLNGTLAQWLEGQGAWDLAERARDAARHPGHDPRAALEIFLVGSNLARRPLLSVRPKSLVVGPAVAGELCQSRLVVRKGRGRGYLFGTVRSSAPWLNVEPQFFAGGPHVVVVTVDTGMLPNGHHPPAGPPHALPQAEILIESSASAEPVAVPVTVRVVGMPSRLSCYVLRPTASALLAAVLGAALGWGLGRSGMTAPGWLPGAGSPALAWAAVVGLLWALSGAVRALWLPPARSWLYSTARGLLRTVAIAAPVALLLCAGLWCWARFGPGHESGLSGAALVRALLGALAVAVVPATLVERRSTRGVEQETARPARRPRKGRLRLSWAVVSLVLVVAILLGGPWLARAWQQNDVPGAASSAKQWAGDQWTRLERAAQRLLDRILFGRLGLREPEPVPAGAFAVQAATGQAQAHVRAKGKERCEQP